MEREVAKGVTLVTATRFPTINTYLAEGVLIDAGTRFASRRLVALARERQVVEHVITHAHPDHQGASALIASSLGVPVACGARDASRLERPGAVASGFRSPLVRLGSRLIAGGACPVSRALRSGDRVGSFEVVETPGHTVGHISLYRSSDRVLIAGDVIANAGFTPGRPRLVFPPRPFSDDADENVRSARSLLALGAALVCFGHGYPLHGEETIRTLVERLCRSAGV